MLVPSAPPAADEKTKTTEKTSEPSPANPRPDSLFCEVQRFGREWINIVVIARHREHRDNLANKEPVLVVPAALAALNEALQQYRLDPLGQMHLTETYVDGWNRVSILQTCSRW